MLITTIIFLSFSYGEFSGVFKRIFPVVNRNGSDWPELRSELRGLLLFLVCNSFPERLSVCSLYAVELYRLLLLGKCFPVNSL